MTRAIKTPDGKYITDELLCSRFPNLFADRHADMRSTALCWGFEIGPGWMGIVYRLAEKLEPLVVERKEHMKTGDEDIYPRAVQVKEKFGTLRFYMTSETDEMSTIIRKAERQSSRTCETCGRPGRLRGKHWLSTRCLGCWRKERKGA